MKRLIAVAAAALGLAVVAPHAIAAKLPGGWVVHAYAPTCLRDGQWVEPKINLDCYGSVELEQSMQLDYVAKLRVCIQTAISAYTEAGPVPSGKWDTHSCMSYGGVAGVSTDYISGTTSKFGFDYEEWNRVRYRAQVLYGGAWHRKSGYGTAVMIPAPGETPIIG